MSKATQAKQTLFQGLVAALVLGIAVPSPDMVWAATATDFAGIATNLITGQLYIIPEFVSALCYVMGVFFITVGVLKLKDHAENPGSNKLPPAVARLVAGGALVALPVVASVVLKTLSLSSAASDGRTFQGFGVGTVGG